MDFEYLVTGQNAFLLMIFSYLLSVCLVSFSCIIKTDLDFHTELFLKKLLDKDNLKSI